MLTYSRFIGNWSHEQISKLSHAGIMPKGDTYGGKVYALHDGKEHEEYRKVLANGVSSIEEVYSTFTLEEIDSASSWKQNLWYPVIAEGRIIKDVRRALEQSYEDCCSDCGLPSGKQVRPFVLAREPKSLKKGFLFGTGSYLGGSLVTDINRFKILNKEFGIGSIPLLIGPKHRVSERYVQLDIPISESKLEFGNSKYGKIQLKNCCRTHTYHPKYLDYFPNFGEQKNDEFLFTQEFFGSRRYLVIREHALKFLVKQGSLELSWTHVVPVMQF